jgi:dCMP deaminase
VVCARRSRCYRRRVGAVLVVSSNVVSVGFNGPAAGEPHCHGKTCAVGGVCSRAVHAERNAIARVAPGVTWVRDNSELFTTESPCPDCADFIVEKNIGKVYYLNEYRLPRGLEMLAAAGVAVRRLTPSGFLIDYQTNDLVDA